MNPISFNNVIHPYLQGNGSIQRVVAKVDPERYKAFADYIQSHEAFHTARLKNLHAAVVKKSPPSPKVFDTLALCATNNDYHPFCSFETLPCPETLSHVAFRNCCIAKEKLTLFFSKCPNLTHLAFKKVRVEESDIGFDTIPFPEKLQALDLSNVQITNSGFLHAVDCCQQLHSLTCTNNFMVSPRGPTSSKPPPIA